MSAGRGGAQAKEVDGIPVKWLGLPPKELERRQRQSKAAQGRVPWNKGKKHSAGARTALAAPPPPPPLLLQIPVVALQGRRHS